MEKEAVGLCQYLDQFYHHVLPLLGCSERALLQQSYEAFKVSIPHSDEVRDAAILNGDIVSDSEVEDAESYIGLSSISSAKTQGVLAKKRKALARKVRRGKAKALDFRKFLTHKVNKRMKTIVDKFPDIGQTIEEYVKECNVGADTWRRTGILTFDGNHRVKQKPTYRRIQHLQNTYGQKFSYGTTVQLCVARNCRHRSAKNYKGIAHVTDKSKGTKSV